MASLTLLLITNRIFPKKNIFQKILFIWNIEKSWCGTVVVGQKNHQKSPERQGYLGEAGQVFPLVYRTFVYLRFHYCWEGCISTFWNKNRSCWKNLSKRLILATCMTPLHFFCQQCDSFKKLRYKNIFNIVFITTAISPTSLNTV